jgi:hypothetical protein
MSAANSKLGEYFVRLPKCNGDGTNYVVYRYRFTFAVEAAGLEDHVDEKKSAPTPPRVVDPAKPTAAETQALANFEKASKEWISVEAIVKQGIAGTIPDSLFIKVKGNRRALS